MEKEEKEKIIKKLTEKEALQPCPRCRRNSFTLIDGYFNQTIQNNFQGLVIGGTSVPTIIVVCENCGYLSQHALGALGLLPTQNKGEK